MADKRFAGLNGLSAVFGQIKAAIAEKQDKINGKSLSTNDYDNTEKALNAQNASDIVALNDAVEEVKDRIDGEAVTYPYADVITINDAVPANLAACSVKVEPVQDLHGYDKPWVGGAGKNICPPFSTRTTSDVTLTWDASTGTAILNGTNNTGDNINFTTPCEGTVAGTEYWLNGAPSDASNSTYYLYVQTKSYTDQKSDRGSGVSFNYNSNGCRVFIRLAAGATANNVVFKPMICLNSETDKTFAPYTNICPISGHTEAVVTRDGVNIFGGNSIGNPQYVGDYYINGAQYNWSKTANAEHNCFDVEVFSDTQYRMVRETILSTIGQIRFLDSNKEFISGVTLNANVNTHTFTTPSGCKYIEFAMGKASKYDLSINYPSTDTNYYSEGHRQQYTLALGDTYYKGLLDVDTGVFTSYNVKRVLNDPDKWVSTSGNIVYKYNEEFTDRKQFTLDSYAGLFTSFIQVDPTDRFSGRWQASDSNYFGVRDDDTKLSLDTLKASATAGDLSICYELATPFTVQLTPQQIQLLQGQNTLYASTGDISVSVNGVSGSIGSVQEQVNELAGDVAERFARLTNRGGTTKNIWYKIGSYSLSSKIWLVRRVMICLDASQIKYAVLRCTPTDGFNNAETKVAQIYGDKNILGLIVSSDGLTVDMYMKGTFDGNETYTVLGDCGEGNYTTFIEPIATALTDNDMFAIG